ncbi:unnamed protein product, partial [Ascophyllum nodosum]
SSCVTPAGTSNELDVQNGWEENTHTISRSTPVAQLAPRNLLTRWDVSSIPANGIFLIKN